VTKSPTPYDPQTDRYRLERYRILLAAQTDADIREMLEKLIDEAENAFGFRSPRLGSCRPLLPAGQGRPT